MKNSLMIGDKISDLNCAKRSKIKFHWVEEDLYSQIRKNKI